MLYGAFKIMISLTSVMGILHMLTIESYQYVFLYSLSLVLYILYLMKTIRNIENDLNITAQPLGLIITINRVLPTTQPIIVRNLIPILILTHTRIYKIITTVNIKALMVNVIEALK